MLSTVAGWSLGFCIISVVWLVLFLRKGPALAIGPAVVLSLAFPVWIKLELAGMPFTSRTGVAVLVMLGFAVHPKGKIISPLTLLDFAVAFMFLTHVASDSYVAGFTPEIPFKAYGEWVLPYVAGRYAVRDRNDLRWISPWVLGVMLVIGLLAIIESFTKINPYELVFGNRPEELASRSAQRFGIKRAFGMVTHPIYFGIMTAVLFPWLFGYWEYFPEKRRRVYCVIVFLVTTAGLLCTVSRTPVITAVAVCLLIFCVRFRWVRMPMAITVGICLAAFAMFPNLIIDKVSAWTGGGDRLRLIEVDGKAVEYSSSRSRLIVFQAYSDAVAKAGLFGYGSEAVSTFPPQIPYMQGKAELSNMMKLVDNGYILISLRFGWLGCVCLVLFFFTSTFTGFLLHAVRPDQIFAACSACMFIAIAVVSMLLVWLSYDFAFLLLWQAGILSGLASTDSVRRGTAARAIR